MTEQIPLDPAGRADLARLQHDDSSQEIAADLAYKRLAMVNVVYFGLAGAGDREWVLIDAGVIGGTSFLRSAAARRFGEKSRPAAIILTHGHFDHIGGLPDLAEEWEVPVYAHPLEFPYLNGTSSYPPPDTSVDGGIMPFLAPLFPRSPIDITQWLRPLPEGSVPSMPGWRWVATPGHTPGHLSLWRETDRVIIAGDAFITTRQESAYAIATQKPEMHGPPKYFTPDWPSARTSVETLAALDPELVVTGHGPAMRGAETRAALHELASDFVRIAMPGWQNLRS